MDSQNDVQNTERMLFGGSLRCNLPDNYIDVSVMRAVPDHQEVFCHKTTDQSIIFDILEYQNEMQGESAPRYHFLDIAEANDAAGSNEILNIECIPKEQIAMTQCSEAWFLLGTQSVAKFKEGISARNRVNIYLGLLRLPQFGTDIVTTMNDPVYISEASSSSQQSNSMNNEQLNAWTIASFRNVLCSLVILDTSLFS